MKDIIKNDPALAGFADLLDMAKGLEIRMRERVRTFILALHGGR